MENKDKDGNVIVTTVEVDPIAEKDVQIAKLQIDLGNYRNVALKRLGKLPGDAEFVRGADETTGLTVEETVRKTLLEGEYAKLTSEKDTEVTKLKRTVSELQLALKNRPETSIDGGNNSSGISVKDNVLTPEMELEIRKRAQRLGADEEKFLEQAKKNLLQKR